MTLLAAVATVSFALGFASGRWWLPAAAASVWPTYFAGVGLDVWGHGVGDGWPFALAAGTAAVALPALVGVAARQGIARARTSWLEATRDADRRRLLGR